MSRCFVLAGWLVIALRPLSAQVIPVRFIEGELHGFLALSTLGGAPLAHGDMIQTRRDSVLESQTRFQFTDGSFLEETATFTQDKVFVLKTYHLVIKGPVFKRDGDFALDRSAGQYRVETTSHADGKVKVNEGKIDLPADVSNGLVPILVRNLPHDAGATVHFVAFTPEPRLIGLQISPESTAPLGEGDNSRPMTRFVLKPKLGAWLRLFTTVLGRAPPDSHVWVITNGVPAFLRFEGPLYTEGPPWRVDLTAPRLPE